MTKDLHTLYQHGTLGLLVPGLFEGTQTVGELLQHGDTGIGTATGLDGEMVVVDGQPYLVRSDGSVNLLTHDVKVPFATVHFNDDQAESFVVENLTMEALGQKILAEHAYENVFFAVKVKGQFTQMHTRAVEGQKRPYPTLVEVAEKQALFDAENSRGTVVGYFAPEMFAGMAAPGYHLHYLDDTRQMGGHILDFKIAQAQVSLQVFENVIQHFPVNNQEFMNHKADVGGVNDQIQKAEK